MTTFSIYVKLVLLMTIQSIDCFVVNRISNQQQVQLSTKTTITTTSSQLYGSKINNDDTIVVIGGTGGVGQLVTKKLISGIYGNYNVRVTSRNVDSATELFADDDSSQQNNIVSIAKLDLVNCNENDIRNALQDATAIVITIGTTAFPTIKWLGGNTPNNIDNIAVSTIAKVACTIPSIKKIILITSIGVTRIDSMPFKILNLFTVLDCKRAGENTVIQQSINANKDYCIVRPGRLIGGPFTNIDIAKLLQIQGGASNGVTIECGDTLLGDCKRDACSEAIVQLLLCDQYSSNIDFSIISNDSIPSLSTKQWQNEFSKL